MPKVTGSAPGEPSRSSVITTETVLTMTPIMRNDPCERNTTPRRKVYQLQKHSSVKGCTRLPRLLACHRKVETTWLPARRITTRAHFLPCTWHADGSFGARADHSTGRPQDRECLRAAELPICASFLRRCPVDLVRPDALVGAVLSMVR